MKVKGIHTLFTPKTQGAAQATDTPRRRVLLFGEHLLCAGPRAELAPQTAGKVRLALL